MRPILERDKSYTFADYFKLDAAYIDEVAAYFGYQFSVAPLTLPHSTQPLARVDELRARIERHFQRLTFTNEAAKREFLIAPVLMEVLEHTDAKIRVEYPLTVSHQLQGTLDYLLQARQNLLVIEAKNAEMAKGFTQLLAELIAIEQWFDNSSDQIYGAISIGDVWRFAVLNRVDKTIVEDVQLYTLPDDLSELLNILIGILTAPDR